MMKSFIKKNIFVIISIIIIIAFCTINIFSLSSFKFKFDSSLFSFSSGKSSAVKNSFNSKYYLDLSLNNKNSSEEEKIKDLTKKVTYYLLGDFNNTSESNEEYYKRKKDFFNLGLYKYYSYNDESLDDLLKAYVAISSMSLTQLFYNMNEAGIIYNSYGDIRVIFSDNIIISTLLLPDILVKETDENNPSNYKYIKQNLLMYYYFIRVDDGYALAYLYGEKVDDISKYSSELAENENNNSYAIASSYDSNLSSLFNFDKVDSLDDSLINDVYEKNKDNLVYLKSYYNNKIISSGNGVFINDGLFVTTWSFIQYALVNAQYFTVSDNFGNVYEVDGIVTADLDVDIVVVKIKEKNSNYVNLGNLDNINIEDAVITLNSKSGVGLVVQKGIVLSKDGYIQTSIPLIESDEGSGLFDINGSLIGLNTSKSVNSNISMAINVNVLRDIQDKFSKIDFDKIDFITFDKLKSEYYYTKLSDEEVINTVPKFKWKKYKKIGNIDKNIKLKLVKASYKDNIVSLRYKNNISNFIPSMNLAGNFRDELIKDGYKEVLISDSKYIYTNKKYKVVIMSEFDYLIVMLVKL